MAVKLNDFTGKFKDFFFKNKKNTIIFAIGVIGIIAIGLSEVFPAKENGVKLNNAKEISVEQYVDLLEDKTSKMISDIDGAGKCRVMITIETSKEQDYAINENISLESSKDSDSEDQNKQLQTEIVVVEIDGEDKALITKSIEPKIRGVLILCEGADDLKVNEKITEAVKTVLGVSSNKVCVLKLK